MILKCTGTCTCTKYISKLLVLLLLLFYFSTSNFCDLAFDGHYKDYKESYCLSIVGLNVLSYLPKRSAGTFFKVTPTLDLTSNLY